MNKFIVAALLLTGSAALSNAASVALVFNESNTISGTTNISAAGVGNGASSSSTLTLNKSTSVYSTLVAYLPLGMLYSATAAAYSSTSTDKETGETTTTVLWTNTTAISAVAEASGVSEDALKSITAGFSNGQKTSNTTLTFNGLTAGATYSFSIIFAEVNSKGNSEDTTLTISAGTLVTSTYYDLYTENDTGTTSNTCIGVDTAGAANAIAAVFTATASTDGTITISTQYKTAISFLSIATVPEPSAFGLLAGMGALALVASRRRRRRARVASAGIVVGN